MKTIQTPPYKALSLLLLTAGFLPLALYSAASATIPSVEIQGDTTQHVILKEFTAGVLRVEASLDPLVPGYGLRYVWKRGAEQLSDSTLKTSSGSLVYGLGLTRQPTNALQAAATHSVGTYEVEVFPVLLSTPTSAPLPELEPKKVTVHVSVYSSFVGNSSGGTLTSPVGLFDSTATSWCGNSDVDRWHAYFPFDGPNASPPSTHFPNIYDESNLVVETCIRLNSAQLDTCVQIKLQEPPYTEMDCNDDDTAWRCGKLSRAKAIGLQTGKTYRAAVVYDSSTLGGATTVSFRWVYTDY